MKSRLMTAWLSLALAGFAACEQQGEEGSLTEEIAGEYEMEDEPQVDATEVASWEAALSPAATGSAVSGQASIRATGEGDSEVATSIEGAEPGRTYPWHIHSGSCGSGGPIFGAAGDYQPVTTNDAGEGEAEAIVPVGLDPEGDYYVNVHASPEDLATIVACGEVTSR